MTNILVVEDEQSILENIVETLTLEHFEVRGAPNGRIGVELAKRHVPDLIICDIMMPELDGYGVLVEIRSDPQTAGVPLIFLTARTSRNDLRRGMTLGADDYLTKPFTVPELLAAIRIRLDKQERIAREKQRMLEQLSYNIIAAMPHEFRTPLSSIMGYSSILVEEAKSVSSDDVYQMSQKIFESATRLYRLIENYLLYAQIELALADPTRRASLQQVVLPDPGKLLGALAMQKAHETERGHDLTVEVIDTEICVSEENFTKVIEELIGNAFKFSRDGDRIAIQSEVADSYYWVHIFNEGRTMTEQQIAEVGAHMQFERKLYEQQGAGMGLAISRRLVELYGGALYVESVPGEGTSVRVRFNTCARN